MCIYQHNAYISYQNHLKKITIPFRPQDAIHAGIEECSPSLKKAFHKQRSRTENAIHIIATYLTLLGGTYGDIRLKRIIRVFS